MLDLSNASGFTIVNNAIEVEGVLSSRIEGINRIYQENFDAFVSATFRVKTNENEFRYEVFNTCKDMFDKATSIIEKWLKSINFPIEMLGIILKNGFADLEGFKEEFEMEYFDYVIEYGKEMAFNRLYDLIDKHKLAQYLVEENGVENIISIDGRYFKENDMYFCRIR